MLVLAAAQIRSHAELGAWPQLADRHSASIPSHPPELVAELRGNLK
jgi:hypothetical protein